MPKFPITAPLHWCVECNVPIVDAGICAVCNTRGRELRLYPPADVRPAFRNDADSIRRVVEAQYGEGTGEVIPRNKVVLLSKAPAVDHLDDIIVDGRSVGSIGYDLFGMRWVFRPRAEGARRIGSKATRRYVKVNSSARRFVLRGRDVFSSNISEVGPEVAKGDHILIFSDKDEPLGVGKVMKDMATGSSAVAVRVTSHIGGSSAGASASEQPVSSSKKGEQSWEDVIKSNEATLVRKEEKAKRFMERVASKKSDLPAAISFSGGKDSLAMLLMSQDVINGPAVFVDTGLELPETIQYTHELIPKLGFELIEEKAGEIFWDSLDVFGPPSRDYRWCCKTSKLSPVVKLTKEKFPRGCVMFVGQRQYESLTRARRRDIWVNPWIPGNIEASPINEWTALHVWLYLMRKKVDPNPLYLEGMDRIGCWLCPACEMAEFKIVEKKHPELWNRWESYLQGWSKKMGYDERWVTYGLWRWREYPGGIQDFIQTQNINVTPKYMDEQQRLGISLVGGTKPCGRGGMSVEGAFNHPLQVEDVANILSSVGIVKKTKGAIRLWSKETNIYLFADGRIVINAPDERTAKEYVLKLSMTLSRITRCVRCRSCVSICPTASASVQDGRPLIEEKSCSHCGLCTKVCPVAHFDKLAELRSSLLKTGSPIVSQP